MNEDKNQEVQQMILNFKRKESPFISKRRWTALHTVLNNAVSTPEYVPFSAFGHNMIEKLQPGVDPKAIKNDTIPIIAEARIIYKLVKFGLKYYNEPKFYYDLKVDGPHSEEVDFWRNLIKFGREVGPNVAEGRMKTLSNYIKPKRGNYNLDSRTLDRAWENLSSTYVSYAISSDYVSREAEFSISNSTTNAGEWTYGRKSRVINGVKVRDIIKSDANSLANDLTQCMHLPAFLGARSQRGKWEVVDHEINKTEEFLIKVLVPLTSVEDEQGFVDQFIRHVRFSKVKHRVIAAASSVWSYSYASLGFAWIQTEKQRRGGAQVHLDGPFGIKEALLKMKHAIDTYEEKFGLKLITYNSDATAYDSTLVSNHAGAVYKYYSNILPKHLDKKKFKIALVSALTRSLLYLEKPVDYKHFKSSLKVMNTTWALRSGEPVTNDFGSKNMELHTEVARLSTQPEWYSIRKHFMKTATPVILANGDDNMTVFVCGPNGISDDLIRHTKFMELKCGLIFQEPEVKGEAHYFYNQFRLTYDGRFIQPLTRIRLYHKESFSPRPPYLAIVDKFMNYEWRYECRGIKEWVETFELPFDKTKFGTVHMITGKSISFEQFHSMLNLEVEDLEKKGMSVSSLLFRGQEVDERIVKGNQIQEDWLRKQWNTMKSLISGS